MAGHFCAGTVLFAGSLSAMWWQQQFMLFEATGKVFAANIQFPEPAGDNFTDWIQPEGHQLDHTLN